MPTPQRLPIVNSDDGVWGDIIRQYIMKEHYDDGTDNAVNGGHQKITIRAGTATAGTAPLKFTAGTVLSTPEAGAMEFDSSDNLFFTITTGTTRKKVMMVDDSSGALGDMYYRTSGGPLARIPLGTTGQILTAGSGTPVWNAPNSGNTTSTKTSSYTVGLTDTVIFADATSGAVVITLPLASGSSGYRFYVKRIDNSGNSCTITRTSTDTIDGQTSISFDQQYTSVTVVSNGTAWYIL